MAETRIYVVTTPAGKRLVEAPNPSKAIRFVTHAGVTCEAASAREVAVLMSEGLKLESISEDAADGTPE